MSDRIEAIKQLVALRDSGALTPQEFEAEKARVLGTVPMSVAAPQGDATPPTPPSPPPPAEPPGMALAARTPSKPPVGVINVTNDLEPAPKAKGGSSRSALLVLGVLVLVLAGMGGRYLYNQQLTVERLAQQAAAEAAARAAQQAQMEQERAARAAEQAALEAERSRRAQLDALPNISPGAASCVDCSGMFSDCTRVSCTVTNVGKVGAYATVRLYADQTSIEQSTSILERHESETITVDIPVNAAGCQCTVVQSYQAGE